LTLLTGLLFGLALSTASTVLAERNQPPAAAAAPPPAKSVAAIPWEDARLLAEVLQRVRENYVDDVDDHRLMRQAAHGLVESLDEYSSFLDGEEYQELRLSTSGSYAGIGIEVDNAADGIRIEHSIPGSPAELAGLRANDIIVAIDNVPVVISELDAAINSMRGAPGTTVALRVKRQGQPLEFSVVRSTVECRASLRSCCRRGSATCASPASPMSRRRSSSPRSRDSRPISRGSRD
jgi:carboxyl-terminal processing protease